MDFLGAYSRWEDGSNTVTDIEAWESTLTLFAIALGSFLVFAHPCVRIGRSGVWLKNPLVDTFLPWAKIEEVKFDGMYPRIRAEGRWYRLYGLESSTLDYIRGRESKLEEPLSGALVDARGGSWSKSRIVKRPSVLDPWFLGLFGIAFSYVAWVVVAYYWHHAVPSS